MKQVTTTTTYPLTSPFSCFLWSILCTKLKDSSAETLPKLVKLCYIPHHSVWVRVYFPTQKKWYHLLSKSFSSKKGQG